MLKQLQRSVLVGSLVMANSLGQTSDAEALSGIQGQGDSSVITPFTVNVSESVLNDLEQRLADTRFPDQIGQILVLRL